MCYWSRVTVRNLFSSWPLIINFTQRCNPDTSGRKVFDIITLRSQRSLRETLSKNIFPQWRKAAQRLNYYFLRVRAVRQYSRHLATSLTASEPWGTVYSSSISHSIGYFFFWIS